jgi:hypothetical protein
MPYQIEKRGSKFAVVKDVPGESRTTMGSFDTEKEAKDQLAALHASEGDKTKAGGNVSPPFGKKGSTSK